MIDEIAIATVGPANVDMPAPEALRRACRLVIRAAREEPDLARQLLLAGHALALALLAKRMTMEQAHFEPQPAGTEPIAGQVRRCTAELSLAVQATLARTDPEFVRSLWIGLDEASVATA